MTGIGTLPRGGGWESCIVPGGTEVIAVEQVTVWRWYRGLAGIVRADDTDGAGVRSGS